MVYLNESDIKGIGIHWNDIIPEIEKAVRCLENSDFAQPIKPYLRYRELENRIIAMPAFLGGDFDIAGIKWIASFPKNIHRGIPRAHSVVVLNNAESGEPVGIINTPLLSIIRTASVSGTIIKYFDRVRNLKDIRIGIIGWGPIGRYHYEMCKELLGEKISDIYIYDIMGVDLGKNGFGGESKLHIVNSWEEAYLNCDIVMTCTVSKATYIDKKPKTGALLLNVSLRDYKPQICDYVEGGMIVDDWDEVCREKTDIEVFSIQKGLKKEETKSIVDVVCKGCFAEYAPKQVLMFNPMGMAVFDIAVGNYYYKKALSLGRGIKLA